MADVAHEMASHEEACETSCKQVAQDTWPFPLFIVSPILPSLIIIRLAFIGQGLPLIYFFFPPAHSIIVVRYVGVEEILWVCHWLPHRTFAQGLCIPFMGLPCS